MTTINSKTSQTPFPLEKAGMRCIIAEKPGVAREIANIVGAKDKKDGYLSGNGYLVTWALGHLIQPAMPEDYGMDGFSRKQLPIIPENFTLIPRRIKAGKEHKSDPAALKQLKIIESVFNSCDFIIVATDAGREGELIFRYIYSFLNCDKPFFRLWISSLTDTAIREGLQNLQAGSLYDKLYYAAKARSEADWLVGINASRALSIAAGQGVWSLGRVQTPTLSMICSRYLEHTNFVPAPYWELRLDTGYGKQEFSATNRDPLESRDIAKKVFEKQQWQKTAVVQQVEKKEVSEEPPLLHDLTSLQKDANSKYGLSAGNTLSIAQKLYEQKYITYPRTGSRYIPDDVFAEIPGLIAKLSGYKPFAGYAGKLADMNPKLNTRSVDKRKVTDHHALLITGLIPESIAGDEKKIYDLIAGRMLEAFSPKCVKDRTTVLLDCAGTVYAAKGSVTRIAGWREVFGEKESGKEAERELPALTERQELAVNQIQLLEKLTRAKPLHTESTLLGAMESCGKDLENEEQRQALKDCGIGTPATRAAIIETLFSREYIIRDKKALVPTEKGLAVYEAVKDMRIADVEMTGLWEQAFAKIEAGTAEADNFKKGIEVYTRQITTELLNAAISPSFGGGQGEVVCPKCGLPVNFYPKVAKCSDPECGFMLFSTLLGKQLSGDVLTTLLSGKQTGIIKGFKNKEGKSFDAALILDAEFKLKFIFPDKGKSNPSSRKKPKKQ